MFNGANFIREAVDSVLRQTESSFELLVVDNGSTDETVRLVAEYTDPRIRLHVNSANIGLIPNFNKCIELASGAFVLLLPHDDVLLPTALATYSRQLAADPEVALAYSAYYSIDEHGRQLRLFSSGIEDKVLTGHEAFRMLAEGCPIQCAMVRRDVYARLGLWDAAIMTCDWDMWCRIALAGYKYSYVGTPQNAYRVHPDNGFRSYLASNEYHRGIFEGMEKVYGAIPADSDLQKLRAVSAADWLLLPHLKHLIVSLVTGNWSALEKDAKLVVRVVKWAGVLRLTRFFLTLPWQAVKWTHRRVSE